MSFDFGKKFRKFRQSLDQILLGPQLLALLPAVTLGGYWIGGEGFLVLLALAVPAIFAVAGMFSGTGPAWSDAKDGETELRLRGTAERALSQTLAAEKMTGKTTAAIAVVARCCAFFFFACFPAFLLDPTTAATVSMTAARAFWHWR